MYPIIVSVIIEWVQFAQGPISSLRHVMAPCAYCLHKQVLGLGEHL
jgi:hypothetical protein